MKFDVWIASNLKAIVAFIVAVLGTGIGLPLLTYCIDGRINWSIVLGATGFSAICIRVHIFVLQILNHEESEG